MSATLKQAIDRLAAETGWRKRDLGHRVRWLQEAKPKPLLAKGKAGPGGGGAHRVTPDDLVTILLSLANPIGKAAPKSVPVFADLKGEYLDGKLWTLRDALLDQIDAWADPQRFMETEHIVDRILFIFDEDWPTAEISFRPHSKDGERLPVSRILNFTPDPESPSQLLGQYNRATAINGGIIGVLADLLRDETE